MVVTIELTTIQEPNYACPRTMGTDSRPVEVSIPIDAKDAMRMGEQDGFGDESLRASDKRDQDLDAAEMGFGDDSGSYLENSRPSAPMRTQTARDRGLLDGVAHSRAGTGESIGRNGGGGEGEGRRRSWDMSVMRREAMRRDEEDAFGRQL